MVLQNELTEKIMELKMDEVQTNLQQMSVQHWLSYEVFTWQWWLKFACLVVSIIVIFKLIDRKHLFKILTYGLMVSLVSMLIDNIGVNFILWKYPIRLFPIEFFIVHDTVMLPVIYMLFFQYFRKWKSFIIAHILLSIFGAFIVEPFYILIGIYKEIRWQHIYSFVIYTILAIVLKLIVEKLNNIYIKNQI